ncbi:MAG: hypothetical protein ISS16_08645 [Ignavibacteria bacterium]|nr:hypothetical protein [Ignavibacteria bacterium]
MNNSNPNRFFETFYVFQNHEEYFKKISQKEKTGSLILYQVLIISAFLFLYGISMGAYHGFTQSFISGVKLLVLFLSTLIICFPSFFIIQLILGSRIKFKQVIIIILSGFVLTASIMLAFVPIIVFFLITGNNYYFLQLLHIAVFLFSGFFGVRLIIEALKFSCEKENIYPKTGVTVFRIWVVIFTFVGIQLAWNLRPFLGDRGKPFELFRHYEGNFYTAVIYSFDQLISDKEEKLKRLPYQDKKENDTSRFFHFDNK